MKIFKKLFIKFSLNLRLILPKNVSLILEDFFFLYAPIWIIRKFTVSSDGYFQHYIPKKGDVVFDFGAYEGNFTIIASRLVGKNGVVYTFEPQKEMFDFINQRIKKYNLSNVVSIDKGIFSHRTSLVIDKEIPNAGFSVLNKKNGALGTLGSIDLIDLDTFIAENKIKKVDFIKMDIEGAEIEAFVGAKETLTRYSPRIAVASYHIRDGKTTSEWLEVFLKDQGYASWTSFPNHLTTYGYKI